MHSFGPLGDPDQAYATERGVLGNFNRLETIPAEEMLNILPHADVLWLSTKSNRKNIIPAKLWDYLAANRPILSIAPNPEIEEILTKTKTGIQLSTQQRTKLLELLQNCVKAKQNGEELPIRFDPDEKFVNEFEAFQTTRSLANLLDTIS